ncbi:hypothetical protein FRC14_000132 [Serendipita sp. 396]|nr:hypothetical protein FRC14_000132 [Serendipita sp. 396]KAG8804184.1 hypothetical protein FRC16_000124 [Serendipita sp. 398]
MSDKPSLHYVLSRGSSEDHSAPVDCQSSRFSLHAPPRTDLWRKSPVEAFNIPSLTTKVQTGKFKSARVTVSAEWTRLYDQAGLVLLWPAEGKSLEDDEPPAAWVKTGIEFYDEQANLSTVATPKTSSSDWSLIPLDSNTVTIEIEREHKLEDGPSLWIYLVTERGRKAVREITWVFSEDRLLEDMLVGVYVARPTALEGQVDDKEQLEAHFTDLWVKTL